MKIPYALRNHSDQLLLVGVLSATAGAVVGYFVSQRRIAKILGQAVEEYEVMTEQLEDDQMALDLTKLIQTEGYASDDSDDIESEVEEDEDDMPVRFIKSVFGEGHPDEWDYELEYNSRKSHLPYVIHVEEYKLNELGCGQDTVTYYEVDDVLVDSADRVIDNHYAKLGPLLWNHGSLDANVVYIRSETLNMEWEVLRSESSYALEVLGQSYEAQDEKELRHSVRRFRDE